MDEFDRRGMTKAIGAALAASALASPTLANAQSTAAVSASKAPNAKFQIGMIIFENMTNLDYAGPEEAFSRAGLAKVNVIAKTTGPITTETGRRVLADMTLADAPDLDMLFIGGGPGTTQLMEDPEVLEFLSKRAPHAQLVTSVCTGALVLGAAGLLRGYRAATHWTAMDILPVLGATPVHERVVIDRNRITGGGVTAGIDFGLTVVSMLWGDALAQRIQLVEEYSPKPPFTAGLPSTAPSQIVERVRAASSKVTDARLAAAKRAAARFV